MKAQKAEIVSKSPLPKKQEEKHTMDFFQALQEALKGRKIRREEWEDDKVYGYMKLGILTLNFDGTDKQWIIGDGDLNGTDWVVI